MNLTEFFLFYSEESAKMSEGFFFLIYNRIKYCLNFLSFDDWVPLGVDSSKKNVFIFEA